jgi:hypothetical protein
MKASALIRLAIDQFLATNDGSYDDIIRADRGEITPYICCALDRATKASGLSVGHDSNVWAQEVIAEELNQYGTVGATTVYVALTRLCRQQGDDDILYPDTQELQEFRFMYADFLAHYFESIGN